MSWMSFHVAMSSIEKLLTAAVDKVGDRHDLFSFSCEFAIRALVAAQSLGR